LVEAVDVYRQAIALRPDYVDAINNLGNAMKDLGRIEDALAAYDQALATRPDDPKTNSNRLFVLQYHPKFTAADILREARKWGQTYAEPLRIEMRPFALDLDPNRRLRIGYVSPDFREHSQSQFMNPLLSSHDHGQVEIFCYSNVLKPDALTARLRGYAAAWRDIVGMPDGHVAELVRADKIDVLVDLTMHMANGRPLLFARRPAPVQVAWLAYPGTTGLEAMDCRLTDPYLDPPGMNDGYYSEKTIRLPETFWCYDPLATGPAVNELPALSCGHVTFGCLNNFCKVNHPTLKLWGKVLAAVPRSRLMLLCPRGPHRRGVCAALGVDESRVEFVEFGPRAAYLEKYLHIDLGLDTLPYNGHTTSLDSLWMGVPVLTLVGETVVGRAGWSQLCNLNLKELAARSEDQFVKTVVGLVGDLPRVAQLRKSLRQRMAESPLMDAARFARNIESAYREMWRRCVGGQRKK
jgi:predicted O-linked N-acetylglucosamine transferase (SPINDLY family)